MGAARSGALRAARVAHGILRARGRNRGRPGLHALSRGRPSADALSGPWRCPRDIVRAGPREGPGKAAAATLSPWSEAILGQYLAKLELGLHQHAPIFRNRSGAPYGKDTLGDDFRAVREACDPSDKGQLADMRRSGAVERDAGVGTLTDHSNKMANSIDADKRLRNIYNLTNAASVRRYDEARVVGAKLLEQNRATSVAAPDLVTLLEGRRAAKCLKSGARDGARTRDLRRDRPAL